MSNETYQDLEKKAMDEKKAFQLFEEEVDVEATYKSMQEEIHVIKSLSEIATNYLASGDSDDQVIISARNLQRACVIRAGEIIEDFRKLGDER